MASSPARNAVQFTQITKMFAGVHFECCDDDRIKRVISDGTKLACQFPKLAQVAALEPTETTHGAGEAMAVGAPGEPRDLGWMFDEQRGRPELVREFGHDTMMAFLVFKNELREVTHRCIW